LKAWDKFSRIECIVVTGASDEQLRA